MGAYTIARIEDSMATPPETRIIRCYNCQGMMRVGAKALSVFCPHCHKRVAVESLRVSGAYPSKLLATCGDICVESAAKLNLDLIGDNIEILGRLNGNVQATGTVEVGAAALVVGNIEAAKIVVRDGGIIRGRCKLAQPRTPAAIKSVEATATPLPTKQEVAQPVAQPLARPSSAAAKPRQLLPPRSVRSE
jgi:cytoskeletal protein CcmA (bactofilin family)